VTFEKQQEAVKANGGRPLATSEIRQLQPQTAQGRPNIKIAPPSKPATPQNAQVNRTNAQPQNANSNRPVTPSNTVQPVQGNKPGNPPANAGNQNVSQKTNADRPPAARPASPNTVNPQIEQKHQQELEQLRQKQDQERQKVEQQQQQERLKQQQQADAARQQQLNQKHTQQLEQMEQKHNQEEQKLQQKQQQEHQQAKPAKPAKEEKPAKKP
jgi:hypothetical protein